MKEWLSRSPEARKRVMEATKLRVANWTPEERARHLEKVARVKAATAQAESK